MGSNVPGGGPGTDGMAGVFILLGVFGGLILLGLLLIGLACMTARKN